MVPNAVYFQEKRGTILKKGQLIKKVIGEVLEPEGFIWIEPKEAV